MFTSDTFYTSMFHSSSICACSYFLYTCLFTYLYTIATQVLISFIGPVSNCYLPVEAVFILFLAILVGFFFLSK